jgi:hypothetical protein
VELFGWQEKLAAIIALDQMSRHIHRHYETCQRDGNRSSSSSSSSSNDHPIIPAQYQLDRIAYDVAKRIQQSITGIIFRHDTPANANIWHHAPSTCINCVGFKYCAARCRSDSKVAR